MLYQQPETMLEQYDIKVTQITKGRGVFFCETDQGAKVLAPFRGSAERARFVRLVLADLKEAGYAAEQILCTREGESVVADENGQRFWLKDRVTGSACQPARAQDAVAAASALAEFHDSAHRLAPQIPEFMKDSRKCLGELYRRHYRELVSVKNFVGNRRSKNEFERGIWQMYPHYVAQAKEALALLDGAGTELLHGDCNQHNLLRTPQGMRLVNFESMCCGEPAADLAGLMRKVMEKTGWNRQTGQRMLAAYETVCPWDGTQRRLLYGLLLFPEKFWKLANHYSNSHKAWVSARGVEKLRQLSEQEPARELFLENLFSFL